MALMLVMVFVIKNVTGKLISVLLIGGLAFGVWTQRSSPQNCADKVRARVAAGDKSDVTCSFIGSDINSLRRRPCSSGDHGGPTACTSGSTTADLKRSGWLNGAS